MERISLAAKQALETRLIPFWLRLTDREFGGFYGYLDYDLHLDPKAEKGCILNSRILWFFSEAAMLLGREDARQAADHAYAFLTEHCYDRRHGGIFWSMTYDGQPLDTTKHTYNQAFAIYALSAYYRLTGREEALQLARELFELIETRCTDEAGYLEAFTRDWQPESNEKLSENGVLADKTMNTLLHVFEGYSGLYAASHSEKVGTAIRRILKIYAEKVYDPDLHRQRVFFDADYHSILDLYSYGHDIESSWLIDWGCSLLGDEALNRQIFEINRDIAQAVFRTAYSNHSLASEDDRGTVNTERVWWMQAETVLGFLNLWQKEPEQLKYRDAVTDVMHFIDRCMVDPREGSEWFWKTDAEGRPIPGQPIVEPWKCPYHNGRMYMELIRKDPEIYV